MLRTGNQGHQLSLYSALYDKIPEDHILKRINRAVDFSFINDLLEDSYCKDFGRPAKELEMMMKLNMLEYLYGYSDAKVIEESTYNLVYLWFLGLNPEDELPDPSLLAKFRRQRMKDVTLDEVMSEIVRQCVEKGLIQGNFACERRLQMVQSNDIPPPLFVRLRISSIEKSPRFRENRGYGCSVLVVFCFFCAKDISSGK